MRITLLPYDSKNGMMVELNRVARLMWRWCVHLDVRQCSQPEEVGCYRQRRIRMSMSRLESLSEKLIVSLICFGLD